MNNILFNFASLDDWKDFGLKVWAYCQTTVWKVILGAILLWLSWKIINKSTRRIEKKLDKRGVDKTASHLGIKILRQSLKALLVVIYVAFIGIDTASITALIASLGVTLGLALQGSLSNLAGGILIVLVHPFKLDDFIEFGDKSGTVEDITLFYTFLRTPDNRRIMIPNGTLTAGTITNYSSKDTRRVDFTFAISYDSDIDKAKDILFHLAASDERVLKDPEVFVGVSEHADSSINLAFRVWVKSGDYWPVKWKFNEEVKKEFDKNGIEIPYNKLDVNVLSVPSNK